MRYRLRTLVILTAVGPPFIAALVYIATHRANPAIAVGIQFVPIIFMLGLVAYETYRRTKSTAVARWRAEREGAAKRNKPVT